MIIRRPKYSKEEHAQRGNDIYEQRVRTQIEKENKGRIVAIDIDTESFEVADDVLTATQRLTARCPEAQVWCVRIGARGVHRFGPHIVEKRV